VMVHDIMVIAMEWWMLLRVVSALHLLVGLGFSMQCRRRCNPAAKLGKPCQVVLC
jgi:hypothetical protein